jgi:hypothetical protein
LVKLYSRVSIETADPESIPADLVHHFLLALCTRPGVGLCFKDDGWYPREDGDQKDGEEPDDRTQGSDGRRHGTSKIYNVVIGQLLKPLKPTEDARQQELVLKIFGACPELISGLVFFSTIDGSIWNNHANKCLQILVRIRISRRTSPFVQMVDQYRVVQLHYIPSSTYRIVSS